MVAKRTRHERRPGSRRKSPSHRRGTARLTNAIAWTELGIRRSCEPAAAFAARAGPRWTCPGNVAGGCQAGGRGGKLRSQDRLQAYVEAQRREGKTPDPVELAGLRQETRNELERILSPGPWRNSCCVIRKMQTTGARSSASCVFQSDPDEFRAVFRSTDIFDQQLELLPAGTDPNTLAQRKSLEEQRENAIKVALGPKRYEEYRLLHDPLYRDAVATAQQNGTPEAAWSFTR